MIFRTNLIIGISLSLLAISTQAQDIRSDSQSAQVQDQDRPSRPRSGLLDEIMVTAQKRAEDPMSVPIALHAFSEDALAARGIFDQSGLMKAVPSLDIGTQAGFTTIFLRGIGTEAFLTADPSIASYIDGVYYPFSPTFVQQFGAVERVEVLKGPQGTLFGRNASGGAISVTTREPDTQEFESFVEFELSQFNSSELTSQTVRAFTNIPISDSFAVNFSGYHVTRDSHLAERSTSAGLPLKKEFDRGMRIRARWLATDNMEFHLSFTKTQAEDNGTFGLNLNPNPLGQAVRGDDGDRGYEAHVRERLFRDVDSRTIAGEWRYMGSYFDLKVLLNDQKHEQPYNFDFDSTEERFVAFEVAGHPADIQQAEFQFISNEGMWGASWLDITAGVYYFQNLQGFDPVDVFLSEAIAEDGSFQIGIPQFDETLGAIGQPLLDEFTTRARSVALIETRSFSQYLQLTGRFTDWFALTLGGRYQREDRGVAKSTTEVSRGGLPAQRTEWEEARDQSGEPVPLSDTTSSFNPRVALELNPFGDDTLIYMSWQTAEKAHAYNAYAIYLPPEKVRPEKTTAYEIGIKTRILRDSTSLSAAFFSYSIDDLQSQFVSLVNGGALSFENAGNARSKGFDFDIAASVFPSVFDGLSMTLNGAFLDAKYTQYHNGSGFDEETGIFSQDNNYSGNRITRSPRFSGSFAVTNLWRFGQSEVEIGADYYYNSGFFYTASNDPRYEQESYSLLGAFASYSYEPLGIKVTAFGQNLTNEFYTRGIISTDFGGVWTIAPPRQYGVRFRLNF